ncbi:MAG: ParA family protein [Glutamicibacter sp.]|jgi:chromosome partitioning protein
MPLDIEFKTAVALALLGKELSNKRLLELSGQEKPRGQHHMKYSPTDMRSIRYRLAGLSSDEEHKALAKNKQLPALIVTRMTKGGVGKTSLSVNAAAALAMAGFRTLLIDADPQRSASILLKIRTNSEALHIGKLLTRKSNGPDQDLADGLHHIISGGMLDFLPAHISMAESDQSLATAMGSYLSVELFLERNQEFLAKHYDAIVVDTAPGTTPISLAFTYAAHVPGNILTVVEPDGYSIEALESLASNLNEIEMVSRKRVGTRIVINKYHPTLKHVAESMGYLYSNYQNQLIESIIPQTTGFSRQFSTEDEAKTLPLVIKDPSSIGASAVFSLVNQLIPIFGITLPGLQK